MRAILTSPEFFAPGPPREDQDAVRVRRLRAARHRRRRAGDAAARADAAATGHAPLSLPAPDGYKETADAWVTSGALVTRMNFAVELAATLAAPRQRSAADRNRDADAAVDVFLNGDTSDTTRATIGKATTPAQVVALALGSPEFQRRYDVMQRETRRSRGHRVQICLRVASCPSVSAT